MQSSFRPCLHVSGFVCIHRHFIAVTNIYASTRIRICCVFDCPHVGMVEKSESEYGVKNSCLKTILSLDYSTSFPLYGDNRYNYSIVFFSHTRGICDTNNINI